MTKEWTDKEVGLLKKMVDKIGYKWLEISNKLNRTPDSVRMFYRNNFGETGVSGKMKDPEYIAKNAPRIGLFDLETLPMEVYAWNMYNENTGIEQVISGTGLLSWAGKFLNAPDIYSDVLTSDEAVNKQDERITQSMWEFLSCCDVVVGHNLIDFDAKHARTFFLKHDLPPLKYLMVDTLRIARRNFRFDSNRMGFINKQLGLRNKIENEGFPLWRDCREGDKTALGRMLEYNIGDVLALEDLYYRFRPYFHGSFNIALYNEIDKLQCPVCGGLRLENVGYYYTPAGKWDSIRCLECTCLSRGKHNLLKKGRSKQLLINS